MEDLLTVEGLILLAAIVAVLVAVVVGVSLLVRRRRARREHLQEHFGSEYDNAVDRTGSRRRADEELSELEKRRASYEVSSLQPGARDRYRARWEDLQASFVDAPDAAVRHADQLIDEVADTRGYPDAARDQRLADLSVDHPGAVDRYRTVHGSVRGDGDRGPSTEQLREALLASRTLFEALMGPAENGPEAPRAPFRDAARTDDDGGSESTATSSSRTHEPSGNGVPSR